MGRLTVRHAIGNLVQAGLLVRRQGSGTFYVGPSTTAPASRLIAVVLTYVDEYIFPGILRGIQRELDAAGYGLVLSGTENRPALEIAAMESALRRPVDGMILEPAQSALADHDRQVLYERIATSMPLVCLHAGLDALPCPSVTMDDRAVGALAVQHLLALGHRRLGFLMKADDVQGLRRLEGGLAALSAGGLALDAAWTRLFTTGGHRRAAVWYAARWADSPPPERPTAIVCYNDETAAHIWGALHALGATVPDAVSLTGCDDADVGHVIPGGLTTVEHPKEAMGRRAASLVLAQIRGGRPASVVFPPIPRYRGSSAPLPDLVPT